MISNESLPKLIFSGSGLSSPVVTSALAWTYHDPSSKDDWKSTYKYTMWKVQEIGFGSLLICLSIIVAFLTAMYPWTYPFSRIIITCSMRRETLSFLSIHFQKGMLILKEALVMIGIEMSSVGLNLGSIGRMCGWVALKKVSKHWSWIKGIHFSILLKNRCILLFLSFLTFRFTLYE